MIIRPVGRLARLSLGASLIVGLAACEEKPSDDAEIKVPPVEAPPKEPEKVAPKEAALPPPAEVCVAVVGAIKAKDEAKFLALSTDTTAGALGVDGAKDYVMTRLAAATCGAGKVEGDTATVAVSLEEGPHDLPFVKASDGWKFDGATYLVKYPPDHAKGKKGKDHAKGKGAKGKKKKK